MGGQKAPEDLEKGPQRAANGPWATPASSAALLSKIGLTTTPGLMFRVKVNGVEDVVLAHLAGKMKIHNIRVLPGDTVLIELSPDGHRGRIVRRM